MDAICETDGEMKAVEGKEELERGRNGGLGLWNVKRGRRRRRGRRSCRAGARDRARATNAALERNTSRSEPKRILIFFFSALFSLSFFLRRPCSIFTRLVSLFSLFFLAGQHRAPCSCRLENRTNKNKNKSKRKEKKTTSTRVASREAPWLSSWHDVLQRIILAREFLSEPSNCRMSCLNHLRKGLNLRPFSSLTTHRFSASFLNLPWSFFLRGKSLGFFGSGISLAGFFFFFLTGFGIGGTTSFIEATGLVTASVPLTTHTCLGFFWLPPPYLALVGGFFFCRFLLYLHTSNNGFFFPGS